MNTLAFPLPLSKDEEKDYMIRATLGDEYAVCKLIEHNLRLVAFVVNRFQNTKHDREDLMSIGTIGLIKAVKTFNLEKNIKFITYASKCIENEILMILRKSKKHQQDVFLEEIISNDKEGNGLTILDMVGTEKEIIEEDVEKKEQVAFLRKIIEKLPEKEKMIIKYRFGIGCMPKTQVEIAETFQISQSYVSRIEQRVLEKIKTKLHQF